MSTNNDLKNTHINFEFELELLSVFQTRMAKKLSMRRELGDCPQYHAAVNAIETASIAIREQWRGQFGEYPRKDI